MQIFNPKQVYTIFARIAIKNNNNTVLFRNNRITTDSQFFQKQSDNWLHHLIKFKHDQCIKIKFVQPHASMFWISTTCTAAISSVNLTSCRISGSDELNRECLNIERRCLLRACYLFKILRSFQEAAEFQQRRTG